MFTLNEVMNQLDDENDDYVQAADIFISPPADGHNSDEDDVYDDIQDCVSVNDLPARQLRSQASAKITLTDGNIMTIGDIHHYDDSDDDDVESIEENTGHSRTGRRQTTEVAKRLWRKEDIYIREDEWDYAKPDFLQEDLTPTKCFERFFDNHVIEHIVRETIRYARDKGDHLFNTSEAEIRAFIGILFISGYSDLPRRYLYWQQQDDVYNIAIGNTMSRGRFDQLMRYLHLADNNNLAPEDKFAKVRPLFDLLNERFIKYFPLQRELSIDESMIPYYGKHSLKQCIRSKPIRFGYKQWVLATPLGYALHLEPYQGRSSGYDRKVGLGHSVVVDLTNRLPKGPNFHIFFDNFFTGFKLLRTLSENGISGTGTIKANRIEDCPINVKAMKKTPRGTFDYRHDRSDDILVCSWNDNSVVTLASNIHGIYPLAKANRWSVKEKGKVEIDQPQVVKRYNLNMGGVDRTDQNVACYRINIRSKKWWWPLFAFLPDVAINNAWLLYRESPANLKEPLDQLSFKRSVVQVYTKLFQAQQNVPRGYTGPSKRLKVAEDIRLSGKSHFLKTMPKQRRCRHCGQKANLMCCACTVPLHRKCAADFHA